VLFIEQNGVAAGRGHIILIIIFNKSHLHFLHAWRGDQARARAAVQEIHPRALSRLRFLTHTPTTTLCTPLSIQVVARGGGRGYTPTQKLTRSLIRGSYTIWN